MRSPALAFLALASLAGCSPQAGPAPANTPPAVALPDLSKAVPSVQRQIKDRAAALDDLRAKSATPAQLGEAYGALGKLLMAAQFVEAADAAFRAAAGAQPDDFRWTYYLAHLARNRGDSPAALAHFRRSSELRPEDVATRIWLGDTYLQLGQPKEAHAEFEAARSRQPSSVSALFGLGRAALDLRDYRAAIAHLEEVLKRDPAAVSAHYPLSRAYAAVGDTNQAQKHLRLRADHQILPADPLIVELETVLESPQSYETLGIRALERQDFRQAAEHFRQGLALAPDSAALHHRLGTALGLGGDREAARREFEVAATLAPDYHLAQYSLGLLLQEDGRHADAVGRFDAALAARPGYTEARLRLASNLRRVGRVDRAIQEYRRVLAEAPGDREATMGLAMALAASGRHRDARDLLRAAAAGPDGSVFKHGLARLLATAPDDTVRDGVRAMILAQELMAEGRSLELGETMAMAVAEIGDFVQAQAIQRDLIEAAGRAGLVSMRARLSANLLRYQKREPVRIPWTLEEIP